MKYSVWKASLTYFAVFQIEDNYTYNFRWYTEHACPEMPLECVVTDPNTMDQYDLSRWESNIYNMTWLFQFSILADSLVLDEAGFLCRQHQKLHLL